ncbi:hypothetical protein HZS_5439, partial [Henneguya salminicola]
MGSEINDQQLGCLWLKDNMISLSLSGKINFLDPNNPSSVDKFYWGHNKGIVSATLTKDKKILITGSFDGNINFWEMDTGKCRPFIGSPFSSQVTAISIHGDSLTVALIGKIVRFGSISKCEISPESVTSADEILSVVMLDQATSIIGCVRFWLIEHITVLLPFGVGKNQLYQSAEYKKINAELFVTRLISCR